MRQSGPSLSSAPRSRIERQKEPALGLAYKKLEAVKNDLDTWRETTLGADFPEFQDHT